MYRRTNVIYRVVDALFRNRNLVLITLLCVAIPVALLLIFKSKGFAAGTSVSIVQSGQQIKSQIGVNVDQPGWKTQAEVHVAKLTTLLKDVRQGGFVDEVFRRAALSNPISLAPGANDKRVGKFLSAISLKTDGDNLFTINLNWEDGEECKKLVQAVQDQYIVSEIQSKQAASQSGVTFFEEQIKETDQKLKEAMAERERFRRLHPELGPDIHTVLTDRLDTMEDRLRRAQLAIVEGGTRQTLIAPQLNRASKYLETESAPTPGSSTESASQKSLQELEDKRAQMLSGVGAFRKDSDEIRALDRQIEKLRSQAAKDRRTRLRGGTVRRQLNPHYAELMEEANQTVLTAKTARIEVAELTQKIAVTKRELANLPALQNKMEDLDLKVKSAQDHMGTLRNGLQNAKQQANFERDQASQTLKQVGEIYAVNLAGTSKRIQMGVISLILGLIVAGLMVALKEWADPTIRYETDIEQALDIPVLTGLPETRAVLAPRTVGSNRTLRGKSRESKGLLP